MPLRSWPKDTTYRDTLGPAMEVQTVEEAAEYLESLILYYMTYNSTREEATRIVLSNLGYYAGYYDYETQARVQRLFGAAHPIFEPVLDEEEDENDDTIKRLRSGVHSDSSGEDEGSSAD